MLLLVQAPHADVDALAGLREIRFHFFTDEEILHVGVLVEQVERAVDRVVVGEGDVRHPPLFGDAVDVFGRVVAVAGVGAAEVLEDREAAVAVQVRTLQSRVRESLRRHASIIELANVLRTIVQPEGIFYNSRARDRLSGSV